MGYVAFPQVREARDPSAAAPSAAPRHTVALRGVVLLLALSMGLATFTFGGAGTADLANLAMRVRDMGALALGDMGREIARVAQAARADAHPRALAHGTSQSLDGPAVVAVAPEVVQVPAATLAGGPAVGPVAMVEHAALDPATARVRTTGRSEPIHALTTVPAPVPAAPASPPRDAGPAASAGGTQGTALSAGVQPSSSLHADEPAVAIHGEGEGSQDGDAGSPPEGHGEAEAVATDDLAASEAALPGNAGSAPGHAGELPGNAGPPVTPPGLGGSAGGPPIAPPGQGGGAGAPGRSEDGPADPPAGRGGDIATQQRDPRPEPRQGADSQPEPEPEPQPES